MKDISVTTSFNEEDYTKYCNRLLQYLRLRDYKSQSN